MKNEKWRIKNEKLWWGRKAIPPVVAQIFSGDSTSPLTREARVLAISYILWNRQSVHKEESLVFAVYVWLWWIVKIFVREWACPSRNIIVIIKNNLIELLCKINYNLPLILDSFKTFRKLQTLMQREGQTRQGCLSVCAQSFARMRNK